MKIKRSSALIIATLTVLGLLCAIVFGVLWIGVLFIILAIGYSIYLFLGQMNINTKLRSLFTVIRWFAAMILVFVFGISIRLLFLEIYAIPSSSMERALIPGDKIIVNKLAYGPVLPKSPFEIPWVNLFFYLNMDDDKERTEEWWPHHRLKGFSSVNHGDVLVFKRDIKDETSYIKRCIGLPGDSLIVSEAMPINIEMESWADQTLIPVQIWTANPKEVKPRLDSLGSIIYSVKRYEIDSLKPDFKGRALFKDFVKLKTWDVIDSISINGHGPKINSKYLSSIDSTWMIHDFGPLVVPKKGMRVTLDDKTFAMYSGVFDHYEKVEIKKIDGSFWLKGEKIESYTFENNYYFMMGDNRADSKDSRYIGFVAEHNIVGRADLILFSNQNEFNWSRLFKLL